MMQFGMLSMNGIYNMQYDKFEDWFHEVENYATRSERFYDEFMHMTPERAIEWLQSAWDCSRMKYENKKSIRE
jgi:hypothetical protein